MIKLIIWDYNGTVVDDVDTSVAAVNAMLKSRNLPKTDKNTYIENLCMPLENYYNTVGILNADISTLSIEFREKCIENAHFSKIFEDFFPTIKKSIELNISNILMSSLYEKFLVDEVNKYRISEYFDAIFGMKDTGVGSKFEYAKKYISDHDLTSDEVLFIGDLISDFEMSEKIGAKCILIPRGHTSKKRCLETGAVVMDSLADVQNYLINIC